MRQAELDFDKLSIAAQRILVPHIGVLNRAMRQASPGGSAMDDKVNLARKLAMFTEHWSPKIVGQLNNYDLQVVKVKGEFVWHKHDETDDFFLVLKGHLTIQLHDRDIELGEGDLFVVPRGVEHCPRADRGQRGRNLCR